MPLANLAADLVWTLLILLAWLVWFALLIKVGWDIIRRPILILPIRILLLVVVVFFLGVFLYLDARVVEDVLRRRDLTRGARAQWIAVFAGLPLQ